MRRRKKRKKQKRRNNNLHFLPNRNSLVLVVAGRIAVGEQQVDCNTNCHLISLFGGTASPWLGTNFLRKTSSLELDACNRRHYHHHSLDCLLRNGTKRNCLRNWTKRNCHRLRKLAVQEMGNRRVDLVGICYGMRVALGNNWARDNSDRDDSLPLGVGYSCYSYCCCPGLACSIVHGCCCSCCYPEHHRRTSHGAGIYLVGDCYRNILLRCCCCWSTRDCRSRRGFPVDRGHGDAWMGRGRRRLSVEDNVQSLVADFLGSMGERWWESSQWCHRRQRLYPFPVQSSLRRQWCQWERQTGEDHWHWDRCSLGRRGMEDLGRCCWAGSSLCGSRCQSLGRK